jgi:ABC-type Mn2+/Zn2+ transport system permease subunit
MVTLAGASGAILGVGGTFASDQLSWPPGPTIVLLGFAWLIISFFVRDIRKKQNQYSGNSAKPSDALHLGGVGAN